MGDAASFEPTPEEETPIGRLRAFWTAILTRMLLDACGSLHIPNAKEGEREQAILEARVWLCSDDFEMVVDYSFVEFEEAETWVEMILQTSPWEVGKSTGGRGSQAAKVVQTLRNRGLLALLEPPLAG